MFRQSERTPDTHGNVVAIGKGLTRGRADVLGERDGCLPDRAIDESRADLDVAGFCVLAPVDGRIAGKAISKAYRQADVETGKDLVVVGLKYPADGKGKVVARGIACARVLGDVEHAISGKFDTDV